jgi:hypothetical protein
MIYNPWDQNLCWTAKLMRHFFRYHCGELKPGRNQFLLWECYYSFVCFTEGKYNIIFKHPVAFTIAYTSMFPSMQLLVFLHLFIPFHNMFRLLSAIIRCYYLPKLLPVLILIVHIYMCFTIYVSLKLHRCYLVSRIQEDEQSPKTQKFWILYAIVRTL